MLLVQGLKQEGISDTELDRMMRRNPAILLGIGALTRLWPATKSVDEA